jgi:hypothetical protein
MHEIEIDQGLPRQLHYKAITQRVTTFPALLELMEETKQTDGRRVI